MLLKLLVSVNLSLSTFPFPLFLSSILLVFFPGPLSSDIWCAHHFLPSGLLKVSGVHGNTGSYTASSREAGGAAFAPLIHGLKNWMSYVEDRTCENEEREGGHKRWMGKMKRGEHRTDDRGDPRFKRMSKNPLPEKGLRWLLT
ncbi:hypothetical protein D5086_005079 [Populus alba]|uniref:Uncharacterized protein n=1 Tax=Populus alba TaxID=43335 RepID=A0ACC4CTD4_POPAL